MGKDSNIEWTDHTANLWWGCAKVHTGCKNCYAENLSDNRLSNGLWGEHNGRKRIKSVFKELDNYQRIAESENKKYRVFVGSMMDIFEDSKDLNNPTDQFKTTDDLRNYLFKKITNYQYENLVFLFLTKRPRNVWKMIPDEWSHGWHNVWFGTSISNQETVKYSDQLQNSLRNQKLFLSIEPQVGYIDDINLSMIDWVIQGGESGSKRRPFDLAWAVKMMEICKRYGVPYFFKQIDKITPIPENMMIRETPDDFY